MMTSGTTSGMTTSGMSPSQRAFLDTQIALSAWRAARDAEAQVAHWLTESRATRDELQEFRALTHAAHEAHSRAQRAYTRATGGGATGGGGSASSGRPTGRGPRRASAG